MWVVLRRWRWIFIFVGLVFALGELVEEFTLYNPTPLQIVIYGFFVPFTGWLLLTILANNLASRAKIEENLNQHRQFVQRLEHHQDQSELMRFILQYSSTLLPINHASLFIYDHRNARMQFAAEWNSDGRLGTPVNRYVASSPICNACLATKSPMMRNTGACVSMLGLAGDARSVEYCQPLAYDKLLVGIMRFRCKPGRAFARDQIDSVNGIAPEIALALALSIAQPRQLTQAQVEAQLNERRSIAYDLHNSLAQQSSYLHLTLERLLHDRGLVMADDVHRDLLQMREVALDMYEQIRGNLTDLHSRETADLVPALTSYTRSVARKARLTIDVATVGEPVRLPPQLNRQIFSLLREGLNNIEKHAQAQSVQIALNWSPDFLTIDLVDDGVGFNPYLIPEGHYGLNMMQERVSQLAGHMEIESTPGRGTRVELNIPLEHMQPA